MRLLFPTRTLDLADPVAMGIVNVTPDSFSDGGQFSGTEAAVSHGLRLAEEGASILDVGGESTRPGAVPVSAQDEIGRVVPVIRKLAESVPVPVSVDTSKPEVIEAAIAAGASMVNDVRALRADGALQAAAAAAVPVCLMHMQGEPGTMQTSPTYRNVVEDVFAFLAERMEACLAAGIGEERIVLDPGFGFGKTLEHNLVLMRGLGRLLDLGRPLLVGVSRKSMIGTMLDRPVDKRLWGSLALAVMAAERGARILRVHDVAPTVDVLKIAAAVGSGRRT
ncbi:MAG: dihydropteroate synthase [Gammaproteobacteria bacterium]|nr:MAG: dihydropteroate synthase [Gammaproteobacteria bacterium SG8_31]